MADKLRRRMVVFDDLIQLNGRAIQSLMKGIERDVLLIALKGASPEMQTLFFSNVSSRAAEDMREELEILERPALSRIREAQESIVAEALKLAEDGVINLQMGGDEEEGE